jgi:hypothetical protein
MTAAQNEVVERIGPPDFDRMHMNSNRFLCSNFRRYLLNRCEVSGQGIGTWDIGFRDCAALRRRC